MKRLGALATFWVLQAVWGITMLTPQILSSKLATAPVSRGAWGLGLAAAGFLIEAVADFQKFRFKLNNANGGNKALYTGGLYSIVQYPNYTGEILAWTGLGIYYLSSFGPQFGILRYVYSFLPATFVTLLLLRASGIPLTQKSRARRFGDDAKYRKYLNDTPKWLIPGVF